MKLVRLMYVSRFAADFDYKDFLKILDASRANNPKKSITGALCYAPGLFLQYLEGPRSAINDLYKRILADDRHRDVTLMDYSEIGERLFAGWSMAYVRADNLAKETILRFSAFSAFDPYSMSAEQAIAFVRSLITQKAALETEMKAHHH